MMALGFAFASLMLIGVPIAFAMGLAGAISLIAQDLRLVAVPTRMFTGIDSFVLLAAPFYILAGELMGRSGITQRLVKLSMLITGRVSGGTAYGCVVASIFFSGISGTAVGDAAALGQIFIKEMPKEGYTVEYSSALVVAGSMIGPIIPPSVIMVIFSAVSQVSIISLFIAGVVPGLLLGLALAVVIFLQSRLGKGLPRSSFSMEGEKIGTVIVEGAMVLTLPVFIVGGSVSGVFTPTEAGGTAVLYTLLIGWLAFRKLDRRQIWDSLVVAARVSASIYLILAASEVMSYAMTFAGIDIWVRGVSDGFQSHPVVFLLLVAVFLVVVGTFLEPGPAIVIFVPLFMPIAKSLGIDPIQFAMVFILTLTLGLSTPPVGLCLFVAGKIGNVPMGRLFKALLPFFFAEKAVVILLCLVPELSSGLERLFK
ncbi:MAG: TRAP transporter large permease [Proteobacteria bacterium]|nr:TRAP transporter large permease [Pseudomonadota bacterium]MBI3496616.1 TRAP transporter large permease [Pseudomonadota bacterium]